jgi:hypothetical protein
MPHEIFVSPALNVAAGDHLGIDDKGRKTFLNQAVDIGKSFGQRGVMARCTSAHGASTCSVAFCHEHLRLGMATRSVCLTAAAVVQSSGGDVSGDNNALLARARANVRFLNSQLRTGSPRNSCTNYSPQTPLCAQAPE